MPNVTFFDVTLAAQAYSEISGILAGFSFAILVWLVERLQSGSGASNNNDYLTRQALTFLGVTFVANIVTAVLWALVSGETDPSSNRPTVLSFFATLNFALIAPLTIETIVFVIASTKNWQIVALFRKVFFASVIIGWFYLLITTTDLIVIQENALSIHQTIEAHLLFFASLPFIGLLFLGGRWLNNKGMPNKFIYNHENNFEKFTSALLIFIVFISISFGIVAALDRHRFLPLWMIFSLNVLWAVLMGWAIIFLPIKSDVLDKYPIVTSTLNPPQKNNGNLSGFLLGYFYNNEKQDK